MNSNRCILLDAVLLSCVYDIPFDCLLSLMHICFCLQFLTLLSFTGLKMEMICLFALHDPSARITLCLGDFYCLDFETAIYSLVQEKGMIIKCNRRLSDVSFYILYFLPFDFLANYWGNKLKIYLKLKGDISKANLVGGEFLGSWSFKV